MAETGTIADAPPRMEIETPREGQLLVVLSGDWKSGKALPDINQIRGRINEPGIREIFFDTARLESWDSGLLGMLLELNDACREKNIRFHEETLPEGAQRLLKLALAVPEKKGAKKGEEKRRPIERIGLFAARLGASTGEALDFIGECTLALFSFIRGRARFRWTDTWLIMQQCSMDALPIVSLINFLVGAILAFVGAVQLTKFGAGIYVADLVGIAATREMGCIMTAIIMCGRTGAAFAAQLGTMKVNQEIDAFKTLGISPIEFLVMPRMVCLFLMLPLLCVFADLMSIFGGFVVALFMLDLSMAEYWNQTVASVTLTYFFIGIVKSFCFGLLVAMTSCLRGMQAGNNAAAVGLATTSAVVTGITSVIIADAIFAVVLNILKL